MPRLPPQDDTKQQCRHEKSDNIGSDGGRFGARTYQEKEGGADAEEKLERVSRGRLVAYWCHDVERDVRPRGPRVVRSHTEPIVDAVGSALDESVEERTQ